jgi:hypothetical protein
VERGDALHAPPACSRALTQAAEAVGTRQHTGAQAQGPAPSTGLAGADDTSEARTTSR